MFSFLNHSVEGVGYSQKLIVELLLGQNISREGYGTYETRDTVVSEADLCEALSKTISDCRDLAQACSEGVTVSTHRRTVEAPLLLGS